MRESGKGSENLDVMESAPNYLAEVGKLVLAQLPRDGKILDFGAGSGIQTKNVGIEPNRLICIESDRHLAEQLEFQGFTCLTDISSISQNYFSGAYTINVLEHIKDDHLILQEFRRVLKEGAPLVVYVPAFPLLYSSMDALVGHVRRYRKKELISKVFDSGFRHIDCRYVDTLGFVISLMFKLLRIRSGKPSRLLLVIFDKFLFPISLQLDKAFGELFGKNLLLVAQNPRKNCQ